MKLNYDALRGAMDTFKGVVEHLARNQYRYYGVAAGMATMYACNHYLPPPTARVHEPVWRSLLGAMAHASYYTERLVFRVLPNLPKFIGEFGEIDEQTEKARSNMAKGAVDLFNVLLEDSVMLVGTEPTLLVDASVFNRVTSKLNNEGSQEPVVQLRDYAAITDKSWVISRTEMLAKEKRFNRKEFGGVSPEDWKNLHAVHHEWLRILSLYDTMDIVPRPFKTKKLLATGYLTNGAAFHLGRSVTVDSFTSLPRNIHVGRHDLVLQETAAGLPLNKRETDAPEFYWQPLPTAFRHTAAESNWGSPEPDNAAAAVDPLKWPTPSRKVLSSATRVPDASGGATVLLLSVTPSTNLDDAMLKEIGTRCEIPVTGYVRAVCKERVLHQETFKHCIASLNALLEQDGMLGSTDQPVIVVNTGPVALALWLGKLTKIAAHPLSQRRVLVIDVRPPRPVDSGFSYADASVYDSHSANFLEANQFPSMVSNETKS